MKADLSRDTFDPGKHYRRVLHQQGRVVLDADDNEQVSIDLATSETTMSDVIGQAGVPETSLSFGYTGGFALGIGNTVHSSSSSSSSGGSSSGALARSRRLTINSSSSLSSSSSSSSGVFASGNDLTIAHGRIYVDGILVINDADTTLFTQPFLPLSGDLGPTGLVGAGVYAVYLDAWERLVTPIDDRAIQEIALGGPDTCLRSQVVWQVRVSQIDTDEFGNNPVCAQILPPWPQNTNQGFLTAKPGAPSVDPVPCALPPESGYRSLENQLYRVEIQNAGGYGAATFKWSRENGSVVFGIVPAPAQSPTSTVSGSTLHVTSTGRDASLGVKHGDWVELIDDQSEYLRGCGELLQVDSSDDAQMTITLLSPPSQPIDLSRHPKLRRWDQVQNATSSGILIADGTPIDLENGVQVQFSNGQYAVGDFWLIPARTATVQQTVGTIEWPVDANGNYLPQSPRGIVHHYCKLGIVAWDGVNFHPPQGSSAVTDCRLFFPPLTGLDARLCPCTITLRPNSNWTAELAALFAQGSTVDAEICFAVGEFYTTQTVSIATTGNIKVTGGGWGTHLVGQGLESVLRFQNCTSVSVRDLSVTATRVDGPVDATTKHIGGALEFDNCTAVTVETVALSCASAMLSGGACLTARNTITAANAATGTGTLVVRDSRLTVGQMQYGMLLVHVKHAFIEGNELVAALAKPASFGVALANPMYRKLVERVLVGGATTLVPSSSSSSASSPSTTPAPPKAAARKKAATAAPAPARPPTAARASAATAAPTPGPVSSTLPVARPIARVPNTGVTAGSISIAFNTPQQLKGVWQTYVDTQAPKEFASSLDLLNFVKRSATTLLTAPFAQRQFAGFGELIRLFERNQIAVARAGIVVAGQAISELCVANNVIDGFLQGVVVGVSHREKAPPARPADSAGTVVVRDNRVGVVIDTVLGHAVGRYAIYVGNVGSLQIENNYATLTVPPKLEIATDGIRVFGYLGRKMIVRHNHVSRFQTGIRVAEVTAPGQYNTVTPPVPGAYVNPIREGPLWLVADNVLESVVNPIVAPACLQIDNTRA
jgi:hypothetical protein